MDSPVPLREPPFAVGTDQLELLARAIGSVGSSILITDLDNRIVWLNQAFVLLSGYSAPEILGRTPALLDAERSVRSSYRALWQSTLGRTDAWRGELVNRHKDGSVYITDETVSALTDGSGRITHFVALQHDITQKKSLLREQQHRANHDALTGLACRAHFLGLQQYAIEMAAQSGGLVAVLFLDLDGFKAINDTYGHHTGDTVLRAVADRLQGAVRGSDTVARFGGDEFVILLPAIAHRRTAIRLARKVLGLMAEPFAIADGCHALSTSVGVAFYPDHGATGEAMLVQADQAMYSAKRAGGNHYRLQESACTPACRRDCAADIDMQGARQGIPDRRAGPWHCRADAVLQQRATAPT